MSNDLWLNYCTDLEYFDMNDEEKKIYDEGLKETAKYYYYNRKTGVNKIRSYKSFKIKISEMMMDLIYDENGYMRSLGKVIYGFSLLVYLFYYFAVIQAIDINGPLILLVYLPGAIGGSLLISTKIFQLELDVAGRVSVILAFVFPFFLVIGLFISPPLHDYFDSVSSFLAGFIRSL